MSDEILIPCPKCNTVLDRLTTGGVELDLCRSCGGIWLDAGELVKLKLGADYFELSRLKQRAQGDRKVPPSSTRVSLPCPTCQGKMVAVAVRDVMVDSCQQCGGLWLDKGELDAALAALDSRADPALIDTLIGIVAARRS